MRVKTRMNRKVIGYIFIATVFIGIILSSAICHAQAYLGCGCYISGPVCENCRSNDVLLGCARYYFYDNTNQIRYPNNESVTVSVGYEAKTLAIANVQTRAITDSPACPSDCFKYLPITNPKTEHSRPGWINVESVSGCSSTCSGPKYPICGNVKLNISKNNTQQVRLGCLIVMFPLVINNGSGYPPDYDPNFYLEYCINQAAAPPPPIITSFTANPLSVNFGSSSNLSWATSNAASCTINNGVGNVSPNNNTWVKPRQATTYTLTCNGDDSTVTTNAIATVYVTPPPSCSGPTVRILRNGSTYTSLQTAYNAAMEGDTIQARDVIMTENINFSGSKTVTITGGYDCAFSTFTGMETAIQGQVTISNGKLTMGNIQLIK